MNDTPRKTRWKRRLIISLAVAIVFNVLFVFAISGCHFSAIAMSFNLVPVGWSTSWGTNRGRVNGRPPRNLGRSQLSNRYVPGTAY